MATDWQTVIYFTRDENMETFYLTFSLSLSLSIAVSLGVSLSPDWSAFHKNGHKVQQRLLS